MTLYVDVYEPKRIAFELENNGIPIEIKKLGIGDYLFSNICIERKTVSDFLGSVYSRRLFNQLFNLQQYPKPILFIIGELPPTHRWIRLGKRTIKIELSKEEQDKRMKTIRVNRIIAFLSFGVQVFYAKDESEFIQDVTELFYNATVDKEKLKPIKRKGHTLEEIKINVFGCFSGIGAKTAKKLCKEFSVKDFSNLTLKDLVKLPRIGKNKAQKILKELTS